MHSFIKATILPMAILLLTHGVSRARAGDWWIIAHQSDFCETNAGQHDWNWRGDDSACHSLVDPPATPGGQCVYETFTEGGAGSGTSCSLNNDALALSIHYQEGMADDGAGCTFWENDDCSGASQHVFGTDEVSNCVELDFGVRAFQCL